MDQTVPNPFYNLPANIMPGSLRTQPTVAVSQLLKPYPQYGTLTQTGWPGHSDHYYALQMKAERPMSNGLTFLVAYNYNREYHSQFFNDVANYQNQIHHVGSGLPAAQHPRCGHVGATVRQWTALSEPRSPDRRCGAGRMGHQPHLDVA